MSIIKIVTINIIILIAFVIIIMITGLILLITINDQTHNRIILLVCANGMISIIFDSSFQISNDHITGNLELIGIFLAKLMEAWDVFFTGISTMVRS